MQNTREVLKNIGYIFLKIYFCSLNNSLNIKVLFFFAPFRQRWVFIAGCIQVFKNCALFSI